MVCAGVLAALLVTLAVAGAFAAPSKTVLTLDDAIDDGTGALDLKRATLDLASDGRLRIAVTFATKVTAKTMLAKSGPPGSVCARVWTAPDADATATRPDRLVCVTADKDEKLRGGVYTQPDARLPRRSAAATVTANIARGIFSIRVSQSALGRPALIRFSIESTRPGCDRTSCIDTVPDGGATRRFRLRAASAK